ncbi:(4Fe-4S)-binding protein, partial [Eubacterium callanderi]|uniref:(4Fe-4S)-binding protein n=1 Tax=Eubacterium callanderi TaxID=53442 RepID=UPI00210CB668
SEKGYKNYTGKDIDVFYTKYMCCHSGNCTHGNGEVVKVCRRPWVLPANAAAEEVKAVLETFPSGALQYIMKK